MKELHKWDLTPKEAIELQKVLKDKILLKPFTGKINNVAGVDLSLIGNYGLSVIVVIGKDFKIKEIAYHFEHLNYPYIPGLLSFREGPIFLKAWSKLKSNVDVVFFDGHGIAHPRRLGIAAHMGLWIKKTTIGVAKKKLVGNFSEPDNEKFAFSYLYDNNEKIGIVLRSRKNTKPIIVSPGNLIDFESSLNLVKKFITKYKLPEPTRLAHYYTQKLKVKLLSKNDYKIS